MTVRSSFERSLLDVRKGSKMITRLIVRSKESTSTKYAISLEGRALLDIMAKDREVEKGQELWEIIGKVDGVLDTDYDGHFGNYIYIEVDTEHDTKTTWKSIYDLINSYVHNSVSSYV